MPHDYYLEIMIALKSTCGILVVVKRFRYIKRVTVTYCTDLRFMIEGGVPRVPGPRLREGGRMKEDEVMNE